MKRNMLLLLLLAFALCGCNNRSTVVEQKLDKGWTLTGDTLGIKQQVELPSVVQQSLYEAGVIAHPYLGTAEDDLLWISNHPWTYATRFDADDELMEKERVELVFEGIDTYADVLLNGEKLFSADNQFRTWKAEVKSRLKDKDNTLEVRFAPYDSTQLALHEQHHPRLPEKYAVSRKAPYQHGWDWAPKYKNVGLWQPVRLVAWTGSRMEQAYVVTEKASAEQASLCLHLDLNNTSSDNVEVEITAGAETLQSFPLEVEPGEQHKLFRFTIDEPQLWWPNEMGEQNLYDFTVCLKKDGRRVDSKHITTGIKTFEMIQEPDEKGFSFYFKVNGVPMYAKGANYVPEEMIETWMQSGNTYRLLSEAKEAHFNMLRVWGGGVYPSEDFFRCCDKMGILVWEDFMYAGTMYPYDEAFLENAKTEALEQVKRLASHPSLALWCGGNEISEGYYNWGWQQSLSWTEEDDQAIKAGYDRLFDQILPTVVSTYDGTRPYWPSSPSKGWGRPESLTQGDVHYWGVWWGELPYEVYREKVGRFNSEYGYQSYPDLQTLRQAAGDDPEMLALLECPSDSLYPMICRNAFLNAHEKHVRGIRQINDFIEKYYPAPSDFEDYVYKSQLSQAYGMEVAIEAHRAAKPYNMGTLYWQFNDAWPVISWSSIDYYGRPKAMQYKLKQLYAPVLLTLEADKGHVKVTSDLLQAIHGELKVMVKDFAGNVIFEQKVPVEMIENENRDFYVEGLDKCLAAQKKDQVYVKLELAESDSQLAERYCYLAYPKALQLPDAKLSLGITAQDDKILIDVSSDVFAKDVQLKATPSEGSFSDNYFDLEPGVTKRVVFTPEDPRGIFVFSAHSL